MSQPQFQFANVVVDKDGNIGVIVKTWGASENRPHHYDVYIRSFNGVREYDQHELFHYVYSKELIPDQVEFYPHH